MIKGQADHQITARLQHGMTSHETSNLSLTMFNNFSKLRSRAIWRRSKNDDTKIKLRSLASLGVSLAFLEQSEFDLGGFEDGEQGTALVIF